ncbi:antitoxin Xre-like helix-turn-helix domain-containing protein [Bosea sp. RAF48]|uniref:MbcA/ParS/Xre antitoxin family protein n=1 Tax=Bosea sp. RAF48 TaxID=3237480 RepID=UPI003F936659
MLLEIPRTASNPQIPQITAEEASAAARAVIELFAKWDLSDAMASEILGGISQQTYARWRAGRRPRLTRDLATRLSLLMGIHKALRILFSDAQRAYGWVSKPNENFNGRSPAEMMAEGSIFALARMRSYLDAERGAW